MRGLLIGVLLSAALVQAAALGRRFDAEGIDSGAGLGPRHVALGGAGVALADDAYALIHNPAGLTAARGFQVALSRQLDARLQPLNFFGLVWALPMPAEGPLWTLAAAFYPRIHAKARGAFDADEFESLFLRFLLPGIDGTFDGEIESKTRSLRLGAGWQPSKGASWSLGAYLERIDCRSDFCGVHASSNGFTVSSTRAKATAFGIGARWQPQPGWTLGAAISDADTRLNVDTVTSDAAGARTRRWAARFPRKIAVEAAWAFRAGWVAAAGYDITRGRYGDSRIDLQALRGGVEHAAGAWRWRAGALLPLMIRSTETGRLKPPFPLAPTLGFGWRQGAITIDAALYAHPVMSMHEGRARPSADFGLTLQF